MKASITFREDERPFVRAKVPISVLGVPLISGLAAGESRELRLDLSTAFNSFPVLRFSYKPNDCFDPFAVSVKSGTGQFGSIAAELSLLSRSGPRFFLRFKPRLGDFSLSKTVRSSLPEFCAENAKKSNGFTAVVGGRDVSASQNGSDLSGFCTESSKKASGLVINGGGIGEEDISEFHTESIKKFNGFVANGGVRDEDFSEVRSGNIKKSNGGIWGSMFSGMEVSASSSLPLRGRAAVKFKWGVRLPTEFSTSFDFEHGQTVPLKKLPLLVMSKISVEHLVEDVVRSKEKASNEIAKYSPAMESASLRNQLDALWAENLNLKQILEDIRSELRTGKAGAERNQTSAGSDSVKASGRPANGKRERKNDGRTAMEVSSKTGSEDVNEELRKALMGATGAGK